MEELAGRSKAANSAIENLENLENDTPGLLNLACGMIWECCMQHE